MLQLLLLLSVFIAVGCSGPGNRSEQRAKKDSDTSSQEETVEDGSGFTLRDTVVEIADPDTLDLSKDQLYMDTSKSGVYYERKLNWQPSKATNNAIRSILSSIGNPPSFSGLELEEFPTRFIRLRKLNGEYVLYDPCDGSSRQYEIRDDCFVFYGRLEMDADAIRKVMEKGENEVELELKTHKKKVDDQRAELSIKKRNDSVYEMTYSSSEFSRKRILTPIEQIKKFNLVVNHCANGKRPEFRGFDEIK